MPGENPDAILYDPLTHRVFTFNGRTVDGRARGALTGARPPRFAALAALAFLAAGPGFAQQADSALAAELKRYLRDGGAIATAPSRFDSRDWAEAAVISGGLVFVGTRDDSIDAWVQAHRSKQTDDFARIVTPFGSWAAVGISVVALGGGLVSHNERLLQTGQTRSRRRSSRRASRRRS